MSKSEFCATIGAAELHGVQWWDRGRHGSRLTEIQAEEKYNTQMSTTEDSYAGDVPSDLMLMWLLTKRRQKKL